MKKYIRIWLPRLLFLSTLGCMAGVLGAQEFTTVTATIQNGQGGVLAGGSFCAQPYSGINPATITPSGGSPSTGPFCTPISSVGTVTTDNIPNLGTASPSGLTYTIIAYDSAGSPVLTWYGLANITGSATVNLTAYSVTYSTQPNTWPSVAGNGVPYLPCTPGATYTQSDAPRTGYTTNNGWACQLAAAGYTQWLQAGSVSPAPGPNLTATIPVVAQMIADARFGAGNGTVTNFTAGNLPPLFNTTVTNGTVTPALTFSLANTAANTFFRGPLTGSTSAPTWGYLDTQDFDAALANDPGLTINVAYLGASGDVRYHGDCNSTSFTIAYFGFGTAGGPFYSPGGCANYVVSGWDVAALGIFGDEPGIGLAFYPSASDTTAITSVNSAPTAPTGICPATGTGVPLSYYIMSEDGAISYCPVGISNSWTRIGGGSVSTFSSGNLSPLFTVGIANPNTTPAVTYSLTNAPAYSVFGNFTGSSAAPGYTAAPTFDGSNLVNIPQFNGSNDWTGSNVFFTAPSIINTTAATSSANQDSPAMFLGGQYWTGSASSGDGATAQVVFGTGANPSKTLTFADALGSTGPFSVAAPNFAVTTLTPGQCVQTGSGHLLADSTLFGPCQTSIPSPTGAPTYTGSGTSVACTAGYVCTNQHGDITITEGSATTGTIATVNFSVTLPSAPGSCLVVQNGGAIAYGIGHSLPTTTGLAITAGVALTGATTIAVDYYCVP